MNPEWKQKTPLDQLIAIHGSSKGILDNLRDGTIKQDRAITQLLRTFDHIDQLIPYLKEGKWPE